MKAIRWLIKGTPGPISETWCVSKGKIMNLPPLFFDGSHLHGRPASIDYTVEKQAFFEYPVGKKRTNWRLKIFTLENCKLCFDCLNAQDAGLNCFCAHCCCGIWIWANAVGLVPGVEGEEQVLQNTVTQDAMRSANDAARSANQGGANAFADVFIAAQGVKTTFSRSDVRKQLFSVLFDEWEMVEDPLDPSKKIRQVKSNGYSPHYENAGARYFLVTCCAPCATVQVVDAIMTWSLETHGQPLKYGPVSLDCRCCALYSPSGRAVRALPYPAEWAGQAPVVSSMVR